MSIEPRSTADQEKMATGLQRLSEEDPTFVVSSDEETGQTIIAGTVSYTHLRAHET
mgnify:CR=1 FL=1